MGFLQAIFSIGEMASQRHKNSPLADIMNYLQLPYPLGEPEDRRTHVIRVWLAVADPKSEMLDVRGINRIDRIEYPAIGDGEVKIRERCLYHEPVGSNVRWRFSPILKLGKVVKDPLKELVGKDWKNDPNTRYYKLYHSVLTDYENTGRFTEGSVVRIMADLENMVEKIIEYWSDKKRPCMMLFGIDTGDRFLYPGEVTAFVGYFRSKLESGNDKPSKNADSKKQALSKSCSLCGAQSREVFTLDKILGFATFDKESFLPGIKAGPGVQEKVFPVCKSCYSLLSAGMEEIENRFMNFSTIPGINLYVIPEIVSDNREYFRRTAEHTKNFLENGIKHEQRLFDNLARHDEGLVYHFLFAEKNQAQLIVHYLIEDVPPTRLKQLQELWVKTCSVFKGDNDSDNNDSRLSLNTAIRQVVAILLSLGGKSKQDRMVMREKALMVISALLNGDLIRITEIKTLMVSRFAGLFTDPDWIKPKGKGEVPGRYRLKGMAEMVDFLIRVNRRRTV